MGSPYREIQHVRPIEAKPVELVYRPRGRIDRVAAGRAVLHLVSLPVLVGALVGRLSTSAAGAAVFAVLFGANLWWSRRHPKDVVVLRVARGQLHVLPTGSRHETLGVRLDDLADVVLETKTVERVLPAGANAVNIGLGPLTPTVASRTETKRIVLEPSAGEAHALTIEFFGHAETLEWFAKIRTFLRSEGWKPKSEREPEEDDDDEDDA